MHLDDIPTRFQKLSRQRQLSYRLAGPASDEDIAGAEQRLGVSIPAQVKTFYRSYNGLRVEDPHLEILPVGGLNFVSPERLHFATLNNSRQMYFDVSHINPAGQWDIVAAGDHLVTHTMASFWSNKIWAWVEKSREIWNDQAR